MATHLLQIVGLAIAALLGSGCDLIMGPPPGGGAGLWIEQTALSLVVGDTGTLSARYKATDRSGADSVTGGAWTSSDESVVRMRSGGKISAMGPGLATITLKYEGRADSTRVRVEEQPQYGYAWADVSVGAGFACALTTDRRAFCWGWDFWGNLARGIRRMYSSAHTPVAVVGDHSFAELSAGGTFACAVDGEGKLWCWGDGLVVPINDGDPVLAPARMPWHRPVSDLATGFDHGCVLDTTGAPVCWGNNVRGQAGSTGSSVLTELTAAETDVLFDTLGAAGSFSCGRSADNRVYCWGGGEYAGTDRYSDVRVPEPVPGLPEAAELFVGGNACARTQAGEMVCWGDSRLLQLTETRDYIPPTVMPAEKQFPAVFPGPVTTCGLDGAGAAYCWGSDEHGNVGNPDSVNEECEPRIPCTSTAVQVVGGHTFVKISSNSHGAACGLTPDHAIYCWGTNRWGLLGSGALIDRSSTPVRVADPVQ